ncbi:MAG: Fe-S cluster assembly protein SufD [Nitrospinales bacterium]
MPGSVAEITAESAVLENHKKFLRETSPSPRLLALNESGIRRFERVGFPHRKHEMFTFLSTGELAATLFEYRSGNGASRDSVARHVYKECEKSFIVLVDGRYQPDLSDTSALSSAFNILSVEDALAADSDIENYLKESIDEENDAFAAINSAFFSQCPVIRIGANARFAVPLQILHLSTGSASDPVMTAPRLLFHAAPLAEVKLIVKYAGLQGNYFVNSVQDFILEQGACLTFTQVQEDAGSARHFSKNRVVLRRDSRFTASNASSGSKLTRHHYDVHLNESGAELRLNGLSVLQGEEQVHNYIKVVHAAPQCTSNQVFKNVVNDKSRSSVDGTVIVEKDSQLTVSDQLINNLVLSDDARADSKPNLMIYADDVKCTHGNTVGQVDEEQLFYLKTRGLSQEIAQTLLTKSFAASLVETIEFPSVRNDLENTLLKKLEVNHA